MCLICSEERSSSLYVHRSIYFELCCLIVGEIVFQPSDPAERFVLNGKVNELVITVCSLRRVLSRDGPRERAYLGDIIRAVLSWDPCLRGLSGW